MSSWFSRFSQTYVRQNKAYTCGPAAIKMVLDDLEFSFSEKQIAKKVKTTEDDGTDHNDIVSFAKELGLKVKTGNGTIEGLKSLLKDHYVLIRYFDKAANDGHYAVVKKIEDKIHLLDPWRGPDETFSLDYFRTIWSSNDPELDCWYVAIEKHS